MSDHDFERQLGSLLRDTASDIEPQADVAPRVRQRLAANGGRLGSRQWLAVASMVAIVALLVGTFAWFKGGQLGSHSVDASQIVLHLDAAYADGNMTVLQYHITGPRYDGNNIPIGYDLFFPTLTTASGVVLREMSGSGSASGTVSSTFAPLPADELGARQTLTLTADRMEEFPLQIVGNPPTEPAHPILHGSWRASIEVTPAAGTSQTLHDAAQTHDRLSIQPLQLDSWPRSVRIVVRMGGLMPGSQENPTFATTTSPAGDQATLTFANDAGTSGDPRRVPDTVHLLDPAGKPVQGPYTIPASGTLDIELIYFQPPRGEMALRFDSISLSTGTSSPRFITGPWTFALTIPR
jgi:hypothetical protein